MSRESDARRHFIHEMRSRGVHSLESAPPLWRLLWACGSRIRPPHFMAPWRIGFLLGSILAVPVGLLFAAAWYWVDCPLGIALAMPPITGALFGVQMAWHFRLEALRLGLPSWEEYVESGGGSVDPIWELLGS